MGDNQESAWLADGSFFERLGSLLDTGGPVLMLLSVLSVVTLAMIIVKFWQFAAARLFDRRVLPEALQYWRSGEHQAGIERLKSSKHIGAEVVATAMRGRLRHGSADDERLREEVTRLASGRLEQLRAYLRGLEAIGVLSPLLGLLGTVLGMIEAFRQLEVAGSQVDPSVLSGGIWEALLTTAAGLALAIPAVAMLTWLERIVERFRVSLEDAVTQVFTTPPPATGFEARVAEQTGQTGDSGQTIVRSVDSRVAHPAADNRAVNAY